MMHHLLKLLTLFEPFNVFIIIYWIHSCDTLGTILQYLNVDINCRANILSGLYNNVPFMLLLRYKLIRLM